MKSNGNLEISYMKTYTAGEDEGRLAAAAKELGLEKARAVRAQVRHRTPDVKLAWDAFHDTTVEKIRMYAAYTLHEIEEGFEEFEKEISHEAHEAHEVSGGSIPAAIMGIIKVMVGPAILYLPHGFASAGYLTAFPCLIGATIIFLYSANCLLEAWQVESQLVTEKLPLLKNGGRSRSFISKRALTYPELARRAFGERGETVIKTGIALLQSGVCLTYLIFVPQNLHTSLLQLFNINIPAQVCLIAMLLIQIPLSWIKDIRKLTPTNMIANALILYGLITCIGLALSTTFFTPNNPTMQETKPMQNFYDHVTTSLSPFEKDWFLFIGTSVLLFEGTMTLLIPLQEAVETKEDRAKFPVIFQKVIICVISFYSFFALINWIAFGRDVRTVLTTSLPSGILATSVQLAYSIAVIFTFPLQNFPALEISTRSIQTRFSKTIPRNMISCINILLLGIVALFTMDSLDKVVSLMGGLLGCPIAFCFPPMIHLKLVLEKDKAEERWKRVILNYFVFTLGLVACVVATSTTLYKLRTTEK